MIWGNMRCDISTTVILYHFLCQFTTFLHKFVKLFYYFCGFLQISQKGPA